MNLTKINISILKGNMNYELFSIKDSRVTFNSEFHSEYTYTVYYWKNGIFKDGMTKIICSEFPKINYNEYYSSLIYIHDESAIISIISFVKEENYYFTYNDNLKCKYFLVENSSETLCIHFSGYNFDIPQFLKNTEDEDIAIEKRFRDKEEILSRVPFLNHVRGIKTCDHLYLIDCFGGKPSYGIFDGKNNVSKKVIKSLNSIVEQYSKVITFGSSKGGFQSLFYGNKIDKVEEIISLVPQINLNSYKKNVKATNFEFYEYLCFEKINLNTLENTNRKTYIYTNSKDVHYLEHLEFSLDRKNTKLELVPLVYDNHQNIVLCNFKKILDLHLKSIDSSYTIKQITKNDNLDLLKDVDIFYTTENPKEFESKLAFFGANFKLLLYPSYYDYNETTFLRKVDIAYLSNKHIESLLLSN